LEDEWYQARSADLGKIDIPTLVGANWGGLQVHLRGTLLGFIGIASTEKWLRIQRGSYFLSFYHPSNIDTQRRFFDRYLKGEEAAWTGEPTVQVVLRSADDGIEDLLEGPTWPLPQTSEYRLHLDASTMALAAEQPGDRSQVTYAAATGQAVFTTAPLDEALDFAGPISLTLRVSSTTMDADIFAVLRAYKPDGNEVMFHAASGPGSPVSLGWLRASHRKTDPQRSGFLQPFHTHRVHEPLTPGHDYDLVVEIWPASLHLPAGSRLELSLLGRDFSRAVDGPGFTGHEHPEDRPPQIFRGEQTLKTGPGETAYLSLPRINRATETP
jgi:predicted acyl esterase